MISKKTLAGRLRLLLLVVALTAQAQTLPARQEILAKMTLADAYFVAS